jgi:hypothetical protein
MGSIVAEGAGRSSSLIFSISAVVVAIRTDSITSRKPIAPMQSTCQLGHFQMTSNEDLP